MELWEPVELERNKSYRWHIGSLSLWVRHDGNEWLEMHLHGDDRADDGRLVVAEECNPPPDGWNRLICRERSDTFRLRPLPPDRPVVVGSSTVLKLLPGCGARFFVMIPLWVSLQAGDGYRYPLMELPSVVLSNTWFGGLTNGELCYSLKTTAHMALDGIASPPHVLICPVHLKNVSDTALDFRKLCIHVEHLKVYASDRRLWTNEVSISYEGVNVLSSVKYSEAVPPFDRNCRLVSVERVPAEMSIFKRSFSFLRYFTTTE